MARPVTVSIPHALGKEEARRRIEQGFGRVRQQMAGSVGGMLALEERWEGDRLHFEGGALGQTMTGRLEVLADSVQIQLDLPAILAAIADRVVATLKSEAQKLLEKK